MLLVFKREHELEYGASGDRGKAQQVGTLKPQDEDQSLHLSSRVQTGLLSLTLITPALGGRDRKVSGAGTHTSYKLGGGAMFCQWSEVEKLEEDTQYPPLYTMSIYYSIVRG